LPFSRALLNLPRRIFVAGKGKISFIYDAAGVKQRKVVRDEQDNILLRQKYIGNAEFRNDTLEAVYHDDGRLTPKEDGSWQHEYVLRDHLGNTRVMFADLDNDQAVDASEILQQNHYYPFGHSQEGTWQNTAKNNYLYNGKELNSDFGLNWYAYGFRYYDPVICRFTGVDPIADQFPHVSVYNYAENEPIAHIDLHGLQKANPKYYLYEGFRQYFNAVTGLIDRITPTFKGSVSERTVVEKSSRSLKFVSQTEQKRTDSTMEVKLSTNISQLFDVGNYNEHGEFTGAPKDKPVIDVSIDGKKEVKTVTTTEVTRGDISVSNETSASVSDKGKVSASDKYMLSTKRGNGNTKVEAGVYISRNESGAVKVGAEASATISTGTSKSFKLKGEIYYD
jgi:RHS repeat-associated protein